MTLRNRSTIQTSPLFVYCLAGEIIIPSVNLLTSLGLKVLPGEQSRIRTDILLLEVAI